MVVVTNTQSLVKVGSKICHKHAVLNSKCAKFKLQGAAAREEWEEEAEFRKNAIEKNMNQFWKNISLKDIGIQKVLDLLIINWFC